LEQELKKQFKFFAIHNHSVESIMDSVATVEDYAKIISGNTAFEQGLCLTEHGTLSNAVEVEQIARKYNLKPVHGVELYLTDDKEDLTKRLHQVVIAKDKTGYEMLVEINNKAIEKGYVYSSRIGKKFTVIPIDFLQSITTQSDGHLYAFGACIGGYYNKPVVDRDFELFYKRFANILDCFGYEYTYMEQQLYRGAIDIQTHLNTFLAAFGKNEHFQSIITTDSHAANLKDLAYRPILQAMQIKNTYAEYVEKNGDTIDITSDYIRSGSDILKEYIPFDNFGLTYEEIEVAIMNTSYIFNQIQDYNITTKTFSFYCNDQQTQEFNRLIKVGWQNKIKEKGKDETKYLDRLKFEIGVLKEKKFIPYLLDCHKIITEFRNENIYVGCGRGSGAGSLCNYLLNLTNIDPVEYNLLFERFIDIARSDPPDLDTDISDRDKAIEVIKRLYPEKAVVVIGNKGRMQLKAIINNVFRTLEIKYPKDYYVSNTDFYSKLVDKYMIEPEDVDGFFALKEVQPLITHTLAEHNLDIKELFKLLYNSLSNFGVHAGGVVLLDKNQKTIPYVPLSGKTYEYGTGFSEGRSIKELSSVGAIKFDFLGLKTLKYIEDCGELISKRHNIPFDKIQYDWFEFNNINFNDPKVYDVINNLWTDGLFQLGSDGMKRVLELVVPQTIEELSICIALFRPGPLKAGTHLHIKKAKVSANYGRSMWEDDVLHQIEEVIKPTYYQLLYEEQIIEIGKKIGGFEPKDANEFRKFLKSGNEMIIQQPEKYNQLKEKFYNKFIENGKFLGINDNNVEQLWQKMVVFSSYSFNKAHSLSYSSNTYLTAFLSAYYPLEWYTSMLRYEDPKEFVPLIKRHLKERNLDIEIKSPRLNKSSNHPICTNNTIYLGIQLIKGIGESAATELRLLNEKQIQFQDFNEFLTSSEYNHRAVNKTSLEKLVDVGYFDEINDDRLQLRYELYCHQTSASKQRGCNTKEIYLERVLNIENWNLYLYQQEMEAVGFSDFIHPAFKQTWDKLQELKVEVNSRGQELYLIHCIDNVKVKTTKNGKPFYNVTFKPIDGPSININVWENQRESFLEQYKYDISKDWEIPLIIIVEQNANGYMNVVNLKPKFLENKEEVK